MSARGQRNGLGDRPHHICRTFTPEQRSANGRKGGLTAGRTRAQQARAKIRQLAADVLHENGYHEAIRPLLLDAFELVYAAGYRNGYQAVWNRAKRKAQKASEAA